ncbi:MAG: glycoside hydrolase family 13 protein [Pseudomonadota bacterium]
MKTLILFSLIFLSYQNPAQSSVYQDRQKDWRQTQIVYQVFVDRFSRSAQFSANHYPSPYVIKSWEDQPQKGHYVPEAGNWSQELEFWGGDLQGVLEKLPYLKDLGINVLYLNPIFKAYTNHKYDTIDFFQIDPQYGGRPDLQNLCDSAHALGMKVVLDGVFNHVSVRHPWFVDAQKNVNSPYRDYFTFADNLPGGYLSWANVPNLPELRLENSVVRDHLWQSDTGVVPQYLKMVDGWRLDVAPALGPEYLSELTAAAHQKKADSIIIGEAWNYPAGWMPAVDGVINIFLRGIILKVLREQITPAKFNRLVQKMVEDTGIESLFKSWTTLSNHDLPRLKNSLPDNQIRKLGVILQFTLPGSPLIYYGEELGMYGEDDPQNRGPMAWSWANKDNPELALYRQLLKLRQDNPALQVGDYRPIESEQLISFLRITDQVAASTVVLINPSNHQVQESITIPDYRLMHNSELKDYFTGAKIKLVEAGVITVDIPAHGVMILSPQINTNGYTPYQRIP